MWLIPYTVYSRCFLLQEDFFLRKIFCILFFNRYIDLFFLLGFIFFNCCKAGPDVSPILTAILVQYSIVHYVKAMQDFWRVRRGRSGVRDFRRYITLLPTCPLRTNNGGGKREAYIWLVRVMQRKHPLLELPWGLLALCRRTLGSERYRYAIAWPDKLGTDPMAHGGLNK